MAQPGSTTDDSFHIDEVPERFNFPEAEEQILQYWRAIDAFQTSLKMSEGRKPFSFYDGPPFATGLPHYGHILAGTIKDVVTRFAHQTGHHVVRRFGWDCHGLPVEYEIDQSLGIKRREDVELMGIDKYNDACRSIVMRYSTQWETIVERLGRWIDFQSGYRTMDVTFMESVWWVFSELFRKGLVYRGFKVMPYSTGCSTPLSNFEAKQNYKDISDPEVFVTFPLVDTPDTSLIAWTTTPWTLPSNLATCVHPEFTYVKVEVEGKGKFLLLEGLLPALSKRFKWAKVNVLEKMTGQSLAGKRYTPLFNYFASETNAFRILADTYVTADNGTGIVHCAPAFGEDDYRVCLAAGVITKGESLVCPVDDNGMFTKQVPEFAGRRVKECDKDIIAMLKKQQRVLLDGSYIHSYPFCWRSETPLIYRAVPSWFVRVEQLRDQLVENNKKTRWVPDFVQEKRFHNWLLEARDWAISRNRFWGTPIPLWVSDDGEEVRCFGSRQELADAAGIDVRTMTDLHREFVDKITVPSLQGKGTLRRVPEVFDCWFESGSMPYAQQHYPFENREYFDATFPADFIAEGIDQTRGWFYTLLVISTALKNEPPFKNLIVNGLVLAADGKKMSKRLKNYPDPTLVVKEIGADALRLYLINSPVVRADNLNFNIAGVREVVKTVFLPWYNAFRFFVQNYRVFVAKNKWQVDFQRVPTNVMDRWILASTQSLIQYVRDEMHAYRLYTVVPRLLNFINQLTNWYVRLNRPRIKGDAGADEAFAALNTLLEVLLSLACSMAPFTPFLTEYMYQTLRKVLPASMRADSIHFVDFPQPRTDAKDDAIELRIARMQAVVESGRQLREMHNKPLKLPIRTMIVAHTDAEFLEDIRKMLPYVQEELNVRNVELTQDEEKYSTLKPDPDNKKLGPRLGKTRAAVMQKITAMTNMDLRTFKKAGSVVFEVAGTQVSISTEELRVSHVVRPDLEKLAGLASETFDAVTLLDVSPDTEMLRQGLAREVATFVQKMRKKAGLIKQDPIEVFYEDQSANGVLGSVISAEQATIMSTLKVAVLPVAEMPSTVCVISDGVLESSLDKQGKVRLIVTRRALALSKEKAAVPSLSIYVAGLDYSRLAKTHTGNTGELRLTLDGTVHALKFGVDVFLTQHDRVAADK